MLQDEFKRNGYKRVNVIEGAPKPDKLEGKLPAVVCYLYQVSMDTEGLGGNVHRELVEVDQGDGSTAEFTRRRRVWVRLDYLISTFAQTPEDEQLLMGLIIRTIIDNPCLMQESLRGDSFDEEFKLPWVLSTRLDEGTLARFWGSLSQPVRPAIQTWTSIPIVPEKVKRLQRVTRREINYRNLTEPTEPESGPDNLLYSRDLKNRGSG